MFHEQRRTRAGAVAALVFLVFGSCESTGKRQRREPEARLLELVAPTAPPTPSPGSASATAASLASEDSGDWRFSVTPYAWLLSGEGDVAVRGRSARVDKKFRDLLENIDVVLEGQFEAWKGDWGFWADITYANVGTTEQAGPIGVDSDAEVVLGGLGLLHRFVETPLDDGGRRLAVDGAVGAFYTYLDNDLDLAAPGPVTFSGKKDLDWIDLALSARVSADLTENLRLSLRGDVGGFGFGSSSELTVGALALLGYRLGEPSRLWVGYRVLDIDYERNSGPDLFEFDILLHGPVIGFQFEF